MLKQIASCVKCRTYAVLGLALLFLDLSGGRVKAQILSPELAYGRKTMDELLDCRAGWDVELDGGADRAANSTLAGFGRGRISDQAFALTAIRSFPLAEDFAAVVGVRFSETHFDVSQGMPLPSRLESLGLPVGLRWREGVDLGVALDVLPALAGEPGHINHRALNVSGSVLGYWLVNERVLLAGGVEFNALGRYPFLPTGGIVWAMASDWVLRGLFPQPRIVRRLTENWSLYVGADFQFDSYRVADDFGTRHQDPALNHAALTFEQILVGPGVSWQVGDAIAFEISGGIVTDRRLDYHRAGRDIALRDAPGARLSLEVTF